DDFDVDHVGDSEGACVHSGLRAHPAFGTGQLPIVHEVVVERFVVGHEIEELEDSRAALRQVDGDGDGLGHVPHGMAMYHVVHSVGWPNGMCASGSSTRPST